MRSTMPDRTVLRLNDNWSIASDGLQWILQRHNRSRSGRESWSGKWFVRSTKANLLRGLQWHGVRPTPEALAALDDLPDTYGEWERKSGRSKASPRPVKALGVAISPFAPPPATARRKNVPRKAA